jgi:hypothetical protein
LEHTFDQGLEFSVKFHTLQTIGNSFSLKDRLNLGVALRLLKLCWLESGLLPLYSVAQFVQVLDHFKMNGVLVTPFAWKAVATGAFDLLDAVDNYANGLATPFVKMVVVGGAPSGMPDSVDQTVIDHVTGKNWILCIDDGTVTFASILAGLKSKGYSTGSVCFVDINFKQQIIDKGYVDYVFTSDYPYYPDPTATKNAITLDRQDMFTIAGWCKEDNVKFMPAPQFFGKASQTWRFPTTDELQNSIDDIFACGAYGTVIFEPFSGQSSRGETFEGFLDHPEVYPLVQNFARRNPYPVVPMALVALILIALGGRI